MNAVARGIFAGNLRRDAHAPSVVSRARDARPSTRVDEKRARPSSRASSTRVRAVTRARGRAVARAQNDGRSLCRDVARRARPPTTTRTMRSREICFDPFATRCARESDARARDEGERLLDEC
jgi:hypothetical protein